jgi:hypothetical protein
MPITFELPEDKVIDFFWTEKEPLAQILCSTLINLFFKEQFTISINKETEVWHSGIMYKHKAHDKDSQYYGNRLSLIKLLLAMSSSLMYVTNEASSQHINPIMWLFCSEWNVRAKEILFSLINFAFNYEKAFYVS